MIRLTMCIIGIALLLLNIVGLGMSLRNENISLEKNIGLDGAIFLNEDQLWEVINSETSDVSAYVTSLNTAVHNGIMHYWMDEGIDKYNLRVPLVDNYFLYIASWIYPPAFRKYEFGNYKKAIERGIGLCSQQAIIVSEILKNKDIESKIVGLDGHVVVMALIDKAGKQWWVLDADYGVVIPHDIGEIESDSGIVGEFYSEAGYDKKSVDSLIRIYGPKGNRVSSGVNEYDSLKYYIEITAYLMKWVFPLLLLIVFFPHVFVRRFWDSTVRNYKYFK